MQSDPHGWFGDILPPPGGVPRGCGGKPADIYFVMDTSRDVTQEMIDRQRNYLKELSSLFYLELDTVRLGVISYGSTALTAARLGSYDNTDRFREAIDVTPRVGGHRDTAQALDFLRRKAFAPSVARASVAHVVILLTNGFSENSKLTAMEAGLLKKSGVYIYTVNLGGRVDKSELATISSSPAYKFVFNSDDFNIVDPLISLLNIQECAYQVQEPLATPQAPCSPQRAVDMVFAVDHLHLGSVNADLILNFINSLLRDFDTSGHVHTGVLLSRPASTGALSNAIAPVQETEDQVAKVTFPDLSSLLRRSRKTLMRGRQNVQKTAVVFVDSNVPLNRAAFKEAKRNKRRKIETYVVYIGDDYNKGDLDLIKNGHGNDHVLIVPSYQELHIAKDDILSSICTGL